MEEVKRFVETRLGLMLTVEMSGPEALGRFAKFFEELKASRFGSALAFYRPGGECDWRAIPPFDDVASWFASTMPGLGPDWLWEASSTPDDEARMRVQIMTASPLFRRRRVSVIHVRLPDDTPTDQLAALAFWSIDSLPSGIGSSKTP